MYLCKNEMATAEEKELKKQLGKSGAVVPQLVSDLFDFGYKLYVDNWYTSKKLFRYLEENGTGACGSARANRLKVPRSFIKEPLEKGQYTFRRDNNLLAVRYHDKKQIYFFVYNTYHKASFNWEV